MHANAELIHRFYSAFAERDHAGMAACYHADVHFSDPAFTDLRGWRAGAMWHMLCERGKDLQLTFSDVSADDATGQAHWEAIYTFSATGRRVHNRIDATFRFQDGLIIEHTDRFDFWAWTRMALGPTGLFLGWTPMVKNKVRSQAMKGLEQFISKHNLEP